MPSGPPTRACSTSPTRPPTRPSGRCCWPRPRAAWSGSACRTRTPTSCSPSSPTRVSPRVLEAPAELDEVRRELDLYFEGELTRLRPAARLAAQQAASAAGSCGRSPASPTARPAATRGGAAAPATSGRSAPPARACGSQPDPDRRPLPPRPAHRRRARRLRRRPADEARRCWSSRAPCGQTEPRHGRGRMAHRLKEPVRTADHHQMPVTQASAEARSSAGWPSSRRRSRCSGRLAAAAAPAPRSTSRRSTRRSPTGPPRAP